MLKKETYCHKLLGSGKSVCAAESNIPPAPPPFCDVWEIPNKRCKMVLTVIEHNIYHPLYPKKPELT